MPRSSQPRRCPSCCRGPPPFQTKKPIHTKRACAPRQPTRPSTPSSILAIFDTPRPLRHASDYCVATLLALLLRPPPLKPHAPCALHPPHPICTASPRALSNPAPCPPPFLLLHLPSRPLRLARLLRRLQVLLGAGGPGVGGAQAGGAGLGGWGVRCMGWVVAGMVVSGKGRGPRKRR